VLALLAILLIPSAAQAGNKVGGGAVLGSMTYGNGGIPKVLGGCNDAMPTTLDVTSEAFVVDTQVVGYAGPIHIWNSTHGPGVSSCESIMLGGGSMRLDLVGDNNVNGSHIQCNNLDATWIRVVSAISLRITGTCYIGPYDIPSPLAFVGVLNHQPDDTAQGAGVTQPIKSAAVSGPFVILPG
jgi:hypothetical protein